MNLFGLLDVSGSALSAERIRAEITTVNMANAETTRTATGGPYRRQQVVFQTIEPQQGSSFGQIMHGLQTGHSSASGVEVAAVLEDPSAPNKRYDPGHPDADKDGFVEYPDIEPVTEMVDLMGAARAYGLNSSAVQATKGMITASIDLIK